MDINVYLSTYTYAVEETSLGTESESFEDWQVKVVDRANATSLWRVHVGSRRVGDVLFEPGGAESLLKSISTALLLPLLL